MAIQGVGGNQLNAQQQSLFTGQQSGTNATSSNEGDNSSTGNVQLDASISVMKSSMETQKQNTLQLINSSMGIGQNVDTLA